MVVYVEKNGINVGVIQLDNNKLKFYFADPACQEYLPQFKGRMWVGEVALVKFLLNHLGTSSKKLKSKEDLLKKLVLDSKSKDSLVFSYG